MENIHNIIIGDLNMKSKALTLFLIVCLLVTPILLFNILTVAANTTDTIGGNGLDASSINGRDYSEIITASVSGSSLTVGFYLYVASGNARVALCC